MTGKHQEQGRDNETDARQVWRERKAGEEHKNTGRNQSRRHLRKQVTGKNKRYYRTKTLTVIVAPKDYTAVMLRLPGEAVNWINSKTFGKYESFTHQKQSNTGPRFTRTGIPPFRIYRKPVSARKCSLLLAQKQKHNECS